MTSTRHLLMTDHTYCNVNAQLLAVVTHFSENHDKKRWTHQHRCNFFFKQIQSTLGCTHEVAKPHVWRASHTSSSELHPWRKSYAWRGSDGFIICGLDLEMIMKHARRTLYMQMFSQVSSASRTRNVCFLFSSLKKQPLRHNKVFFVILAI